MPQIPVATLLLLGSTMLTAADWPQWRGPERNGVAIGSPSLVRTLPAEPTLAWSADLPPAPKKPPYYGTPVGTDGLVYFHGTCIAADAPAEEKKPPLEDLLVCVGLDDGKARWHKRTPAGTGTKLGAPNVPVIHDGRIYWSGNDGMVRCAQASDGTMVWEQDSKLKANNAQLVCSPLIVDDAIIIQDKDLICLALADGAERWRADKFGAKHRSPTLWRNGGKTFILASGPKELAAFDPTDGSIVWQAPAASSPSSLVVAGDRLVRVNEGDSGGLLLATLTPTGLSDELTVNFACNGGGHNANTPVVADGKAYVLGKEEILCVDIGTGDVVWRVAAKGDAKHSPILAGDILLTGKKPGLLLLAAADGSSIASCTFGFTGCSSFALIDGRLVAQGGGKLRCIDLRAK